MCLRLCLCGGRPLSSVTTHEVAHPARALAALQSSWLAPARSRLLRRAAVARRRTILDLGAGTGSNVAELARRGGGRVLALDRSCDALESLSRVERVHAVAGDAAGLPLANASVDLVFSQLGLMWMPMPDALVECVRVLRPGGVLAAIEPDYGGMIEEPPAVASREAWLEGLARAGADPCIGRRLPIRLGTLGLRVDVGLLDSVTAPAPERFDLVEGLPLTPEERARVERARVASRRLPHAEQVVHLPMFLILARKDA